ncbi:MAG: hypothetical protein IT158_12475 [Bryobacterales bacterium]|nr:hypothetical protein [Bryobacterales bacterium]
MPPPASLRRRALFVLPAGALLLAAAGWIAYRTWPRDLLLRGPAPPCPRLRLEARPPVLHAAGAALVATVETFRDELYAYLYFEYLRSRSEIDQARVSLRAVESGGGPQYEIRLLLDTDLLASVPYLAQLKADRLISGFELSYADETELASIRQVTALFVAAYNFPVRRKLESLPDAHVLSPLSRFILFKSKTDRRVRERIEPVPPELSPEEAGQVAADILAVARFYELPLDFFLGIGAMENNYMTIAGDAGHAVWKRRAQPGDIVLKRRRGRVLVSNFSTGLWQITRETLRQAHKLYLKDTRDYSALPERLRPPREVDLDNIEPGPLTTYAGVLVRHLLDSFDGDVEKAVGAYNGGPGNPNLKYAAGVAAAAEHARQVVERAAVLNGQRVAETRFIAAPRGRHSVLVIRR